MLLVYFLLDLTCLIFSFNNVKTRLIKSKILFPVLFIFFVAVFKTVVALG